MSTLPATPSSATASQRQGVALAAGAYVMWGLFPLYFSLLTQVPPAEMLGHRIVGSLVVVMALLGLGQGYAWLAPALRDARVLRSGAASALMISLNWFLYIWAVAHHQVVEASLGYFITPLANVLTGTVLLQERLRRAQWAAVGLAAAGVLALTLASGRLPWIALALAATFSTYGWLRKTAPLGALEGLTLETLLLAPWALAGLWWAGQHGATVFGQSPPTLQALMLAAGPLTALPLLLFAAGARRIPLSVLGMLQYLGPSLQLVLGVWVLGEPFAGHRQAGFLLIWAACALFTWDAVRGSAPSGR